MLKKSWILLLAILVMTGSAYGTLVDVVVSGHDDNDLSGTITPGDVIHIKIISRVLIVGIDFGLQVSGPGTLAEKGAGPAEQMAHHADFVLWTQSDPLIDCNSISEFSGVSFIDIAPPAPGETVDLVWNLKIICGEPDDIGVNLQLVGPSLYKNNAVETEYLSLAEPNLGDLLIQVLEPPPGKELTVQVVGGHGTVEPSQGTFPQGTVVPLTAIPEEGYRVKYWSGTNNRLSLMNTNTVTMTKNRTVKVKFEPIPDDEIRKALFKAGKTRLEPKDSFLILGTLSACQSDILDANEVFVSIGTASEPNIFYDTFTVNDDGYKLLGHQAGFQFKGEAGRIKRLNVNVKSGKFVLLADGLDLTGLTCPVRMELRFGEYQHVFAIDEDIINGPNRYIPMNYLLVETNSLRVERASVRTNTRSQVVTVTVQGAIAVDRPVEDPNVDISTAADGSVTITWDDYPETIPPPVIGAISKSKNGARYAYKRPKPAASIYYITSAVFDLQKCTFKITIKKEGLTSSGAVNFGVQFDTAGGTVFDEEVIVNLDL